MAILPILAASALLAVAAVLLTLMVPTSNAPRLVPVKSPRARDARRDRR